MVYSADIRRAARDNEARTILANDEDQKSDSPAYESASYRRQKPEVDFVRTVYGGTRAMREAGEDLLPKHPMESGPRYQDRLQISLALNAVKKTVGGLNGMIFRKDPTYTEIPPAVEEDLGDIDRQGRGFNVFWRSVADNALLDGHTWLHVEAPPPDDAIRSARDESRNRDRVRPYWINLTKRQVINWRYEVRGGRPVLTLIAYREGSIEADGAFGEATRQRIRVLRENDVEMEDGGQARRITGELWEFRKRGVGDNGQKDEKAQDRWILVESYLLDPAVREIPVVAVYADRDSPFESAPPLLDLAEWQREHRRVRSDKQRSQSFAAIAVPYHFAEDAVDAEGDPKVRWSPDGMMLSNDSDAKAGIIESHGYGLDAMKQDLDDIEARMAMMGLNMIARTQGTQPRTATAEIIDRSEGDAWLQVFARNLENAANQALVYHATYRGIESAGTIALNRDFHRQMLDPQMVGALHKLVQSGNLSLDTLWDLLIKGEILDEDFDPEVERERIAQTPMEDLLSLSLPREEPEAV